MDDTPTRVALPRHPLAPAVALATVALIAAVAALPPFGATGGAIVAAWWLICAATAGYSISGSV